MNHIRTVDRRRFESTVLTVALMYFDISSVEYFESHYGIASITAAQCAPLTTPWPPFIGITGPVDALTDSQILIPRIRCVTAALCVDPHHGLNHPNIAVSDEPLPDQQLRCPEGKFAPALDTPGINFTFRPRRRIRNAIRHLDRFGRSRIRHENGVRTPPPIPVPRTCSPPSATTHLCCGS